MKDKGTVTRIVADLKAGDQDAVRRLWERYFDRLVHLASQRLKGSRKREADEEDVALSALDSFCRGARRGRFPDLIDRNDLWQLLVVITKRKAVDQIQSERRQKRGSGKLRGEADLAPLDPEETAISVIDKVISREPTPELAAEITDEFQRLFDRLGDDIARQVALLKFEGYTNEEIAESIGKVTRTVERKLALIRDEIEAVWGKDILT